ncbi:hypothetical protein Cgig2_008999 [Carnegiea gigantea]|uniref:Methyltransferase n=1 Tax=Carnegiea gigantea TaxID=171969 RepID=A0A9Q1GQ75_9CARY|nr:hypothetical protein Cgig2_008999 [Carnegiea gigantea]
MVTCPNGGDYSLKVGPLACLERFAASYVSCYFSQFCFYKNRCKELQPCITPLPDVKKVKHTSGGRLEKWPRRLNVALPRVTSSRSEAITLRAFDEDNRLWKRRVQHYVRVLRSLSKGGYRNVIDMNVGLGGFAAALSTYPVWVMNVVPFDSGDNTLDAIYERALVCKRIEPARRAIGLDSVKARLELGLTNIRLSLDSTQIPIEPGPCLAWLRCAELV